MNRRGFLDIGAGTAAGGLGGGSGRTQDRVDATTRDCIAQIPNGSPADRSWRIPPRSLLILKLKEGHS